MNPDLDHIKRVYCIGIGGIGMSALARYFRARGAYVSGYDKTRTALTGQLEDEGMRIHYTEDIAQVDKEAQLVIYTPAVPTAHAELQYFIAHNYPVYKRAAVLGMLSRDKQTVAVAGTHGKTTVSSMVAWILRDAGYDCTALLGGISLNLRSNFIYGDGNILVTEADEYDRSFLQLFPDIAVITAADPDHLEIYGSREEMEKAYVAFANRTAEGGTVVVKSNLPLRASIIPEYVTYALRDGSADLHTTGFSTENGISRVSLNNGLEYVLHYPGIHNIENSVAAVAVSSLLGVPEEKIIAALAGFRGVHRRFEVLLNAGGKIYIDDYAHHPEEIRMFLLSVRDAFPGKKITAVFQPHLYSRTRDLAAGFAESLALADTVILLPIYPAREEPIPGVSSENILDNMDKKDAILLEKPEIPDFLKERRPELLCTIGAGDIDAMTGEILRLMQKMEI